MIELNIGVDFSLIIVIVMMIELNIGANGCGFKSFRQIKFCFGDITNQPSVIQIIRGERLDIQTTREDQIDQFIWRIKYFPWWHNQPSAIQIIRGQEIYILSWRWKQYGDQIRLHYQARKVCLVSYAFFPWLKSGFSHMKATSYMRKSTVVWTY